MTRILRVMETASIDFGGPIEGARRFGEVWAQEGHRQDFLTLDPPDEQHLPDYPGQVFQVGPPRSQGLGDRYRYSRSVIPWLNELAGGYDAVIVSGLWRYHARAVGKALAGGKIPYFVFVHGMLDPWFRETMPAKHLVKQLSWWFAEHRLLSGARNVLFTTEEECLRAQNAFWPYQVQPAVVSYGAKDVGGNPAAQMASFRAAVPRLGDRRYLLFLSRIHPKKGCDLLVEAFAACRHHDDQLDLVIAGPDQVGLAPALRARAKQLGVKARLHFPGMLTGELKAGAFRGAEAFVLPSHQENFGIAVAEALAYGVPVLMSNKVNIWREVVADGAGLVEPDTLEGTAALLAGFQALTPSSRATMAAQARRCFDRRFRVDRAAGKLMEFIQRRIAEPA